MKNIFLYTITGLFFLTVIPQNSKAENRLRIVTTLPDYRVIAETIGGDRVEVENIVLGNQDAHFIRPKPSFITMVANADILISTGLDLELWLPAIIDKSGNRKIRSEQPGYVAASDGIELLEVPDAISRSEGGVHVYGNPHFTPNPLNMKTVASNITAGLITNDPDGEDYYIKNFKKFEAEIDEKLYGKELIEILGSKTLNKMAAKGTLIPFLEKKKYKEKPLIDYLGGWFKKMLPLRGISIVCYHKNWIYFADLFGLTEAGFIEPKPGIPPSAKHVAGIIELMKEQNIKILLATSYFDQEKVKNVAEKTGAEPVIVPLYVTGVAEADDYFKLVDYWTDQLLSAAQKQKIIE